MLEKRFFSKESCCLNEDTAEKDMSAHASFIRLVNLKKRKRFFPFLPIFSPSSPLSNWQQRHEPFNFGRHPMRPREMQLALFVRGLQEAIEEQIRSLQNNVEIPD
jgi:hypothetical protein